VKKFGLVYKLLTIKLGFFLKTTHLEGTIATLIVKKNKGDDFNMSLLLIKKKKKVSLFRFLGDKL
jgi:hypothetical protein